MFDILKSLPNIISIFRIICVPLFFFSLFNNTKLISLFVLLIASLSDFFDGYLARKLKAESKIGELLDPIADKLFSNAVLWGICFFKSPTLPTYLITISLTLRDLILLFGGTFVILKKIKVNMKPIYLSKICTTFIFIYIISIIIFDSNIFLNFFGYIIVLLIIFTFLIYIKRFFKGEDN